jgi:asparagine synthetase B (glutamine-hydrolysing)
VDHPDLVAAHLLARFRSEGLRFLDDVYGHFSVVLVDESEERVVFATDPYGVRKVFYHSAAELRLGTNLLTIGKAMGEALEVDRSLEDFFLVHGFHPLDRTPYAGVRRTKPATVYEWQAGKLSEHRVTLRDPWANEAVAADLSGATETEIAKQLYDAFMLALEQQVSDDRRVAVLLGGFDSALVASALKRLGKEVETFSFFYNDPRFDQPHTDTVEKFLGIRHHWVPITGETIADGLAEYGDIFNEPTCWPNYVIQTERLARVIREMGFEHCYTGDGCDSVFFGYPLTYKRLKVVQAFNKVPKALSTLALNGLGALPLEGWVGRPYHVSMGLLRGRELSAAARQMLSLRIFDESTLARLRLGASPGQYLRVSEVVEQLASHHRDDHPVRLAYQGKNLISPTKTKLTGSTDATGLLINSPFMHIGMKHFTSRLPETLIRSEEGGKQADTIGKYILTKMAEQERLLPPEVIHQKKVGAVDAPVTEWYAGACHSVMLRLMGKAPFDSDPRYLERLLVEKPIERVYGKLIGKHTNNSASLMLGPSLLATLGALIPD